MKVTYLAKKVARRAAKTALRSNAAYAVAKRLAGSRRVNLDHDHARQTLLAACPFLTPPASKA